MLDIKCPDERPWNCSRPCRSAAAVTDHLHHRSWRVSLAVRGDEVGACDFIEKPFRDRVLLDAVAQAVRKSRAQASEGVAATRPDRCSRLVAARPEISAAAARGLPSKLVARGSISPKNGAQFTASM